MLGNPYLVFDFIEKESSIFKVEVFLKEMKTDEQYFVLYEVSNNFSICTRSGESSEYTFVIEIDLYELQLP